MSRYSGIDMPPDPDLPPYQHGTLTGYRKGCRCHDCRAASAARHQASHWPPGRRQAQARLPRPPGTWKRPGDTWPGRA